MLYQVAHKVPNKMKVDRKFVRKKIDSATTDSSQETYKLVEP